MSLVRQAKGYSPMSDEELMAFDIYRGACTASRLMCLNLVNHIEHRHGLRPFATASGYLQWNPNFALISDARRSHANSHDQPERPARTLPRTWHR